MPKDSRIETGQWNWLSRVALLLLIALTLARATVPEFIRDPFDVKPNSLGAPRGLGAAGGVVLDLLTCIPALLVLLRASLDRRFALLFTGSHAIMFALAVWIALSTLWAADQFSALVQATHWMTGMVALWAGSQLFQSWRRVRLVGAVCFALLLIMTAHGLVYRFVDVPEQREQFEKNKDQIFAQRGWTGDSFIAQQFARKVMSGEIIGFSGGANTYAMMLVLTGLITVGFVIQRTADRDEVALPVVMGLGLAPALLMLWLTQCRAAVATALLGVVLLGRVGVWRRRVPLRGDHYAGHRKCFWSAVLLIALGVAALVGHGLYHGTLVHDSLTFRWRYWVGAMRVFVRHPWLGVGFGSFGNFYLAVRMPIASEEIKDPHNFFVRIAVETGILGGALVLAWLGRLWWEMTLPTEQAQEESTSPRLLPTLLAAAALAMLVNVFASVDFGQDASYVMLEVLKRVLWMGLAFGALIVGMMRSMQQQELDNRPAPWLLWGMLASAAMFLLHNTIEFGLFETGPLLVIAMVFAAGLGIRGGKQRRGGWMIFGSGVLLWLAVAGVWALPLLIGETRLASGDDALQANRPVEAAEMYAAAYDSLPIANSDYAVKTSTAKLYAQESRAEVLAWLDKAVKADPTLIRGYLNRARVRTDPAGVRSDFESAIALNPNDVDVRLDYAAALEQMGLKQSAAAEYRAALEKNDGLSPDEPKRLSRGKVGEVRKKIEGLEELLWPSGSSPSAQRPASK